ncbi:C4-dicarboxylate ABC transporter, partial [Sphingomonas koreensis]
RFGGGDRLRQDRVEGRVDRDATLTRHDKRIDADAVLGEPKSDRPVTRAVIRHDLSDSSGHADLLVDGLRFDKAMQPDALTRMALGVIANVEGTVTGKGRIDWNARGVTSSGRFSSTGLDLAAAFGPARGLAGTVEFTDLLNMVTAPNQTLRVAAINPGIEVNDGVVVFAMEPGQVLKLH